MRELTEEEKEFLHILAVKVAGVAPGQKNGRWTHEDRVAVVESVLRSLVTMPAKV